MTKPSPGRDWLLVAVLGLALALRVWGVRDRLPDPTLGIKLIDDSAVEETDRTTMGRAWTMWGGGTHHLDLNPHTAGWPAFALYLTLGIQALYAAGYALTSGNGDILALARDSPASMPGLFLFGRLFGVAIGVASVYLAFGLAARISSRFVAQATAFLLAVNTLHTLTSQHVSDPNLLALLFTLLAAQSLIDICERRRLRDSIKAGVVIGLATASKYMPIALLAPFIFAHAFGNPGESRSAARNIIPRVLAGSIATLVVILVVSPFIVLDWRTASQDLAGQRQSLFSSWAGQSSTPFALPTYLLHTLPLVLSWPGYLLALVGLILLLRGDSRAKVVSTIPMVLLLANGALAVAQERYILPAVPFLLMGTAVAIEWGWKQIGARIPAHRYTAALPIVVVALCGLGPIKAMAETRRSLSLPDSRRLARQWINASIEPSEPIALDLYGPVINSARPERLAIVWPLRVSGSDRVQAAYHPQWLDGLRYYAVSSEVSRRFESGAETRSAEAAFYYWIRQQSQPVWRSDPARSSGPEIEMYFLPTKVSTRADRDSLWAQVRMGEIDANRLSVWCSDMATLFLYRAEWSRVEEWADRGISLRRRSGHERLLADLAYAQIQQGRHREAEHTAVEAIRSYPGNYQFHLYRGMALEGLGQRAGAAAEYLKSLAMMPTQEGYLEIGAKARELLSGGSGPAQIHRRQR